MWVLIIIAYAAVAPSGPSSVAMQEFTSNNACIFAGKEAQNISRDIQFVCVRK